MINSFFPHSIRPSIYITVMQSLLTLHVERLGIHQQYTPSPHFSVCSGIYQWHGLTFVVQPNIHTLLANLLHTGMPLLMCQSLTFIMVSNSSCKSFCSAQLAQPWQRNVLCWKQSPRWIRASITAFLIFLSLVITILPIVFSFVNSSCLLQLHFFRDAFQLIKLTKGGHKLHVLLVYDYIFLPQIDKILTIILFIQLKLTGSQYALIDHFRVYQSPGKTRQLCAPFWRHLQDRGERLYPCSIK